MCNVFQQLIMVFCIVRQNTHFLCQCQLISSRTSESCYENFFLLLILCKNTKVHLAKAAKNSKPLKAAEVFLWPDFVVWWGFVGLLVCFLKAINCAVRP